ncbi:MAG: LysR family transcriptional regulator, partial [Xanthomonadaceae bacterium]|nr:LysR family transcriptional regulator [Xanthomonadaceae bacterium]
MAALNYNHLRYFWAVAREGNLTRAAEKLLISQSALSIQIKKLEGQLGQDLFEHSGRQLQLSEAGRIAFDHAEAIFATGGDLLATLKHRLGDRR